MLTEQEVTSLLVRLLSGSQRPLKGSELSVLVRTSLPDFDPAKFGCRNLREFIHRFASGDVTEVDKAGMDIIYGIRTAEQQPLFESTAQPAVSATKHDYRGPLGQLLENPRIWKTYASPDTPFRLFLIPSSRQIRVLRPGFSPDPSWLEIPRITAEKLLQIAKDFIAELPDSQGVLLSRVLEQPGWWVPYFELVRTLGLKTRWISYRRRRIADEFERSLPTLPSQPQPPQPLDLVKQTAPAEVPTTSDTESVMKRVAAEVVQRMTDSELRALNLPLGYVVDALTTR